MAKRIYPAVVLALVAVVLSFFYLSGLREGPEKTAEDFTRELFKVAPPSLDREAIKRTVGRMSDKARSGIKSLADIAYFAGVKDLPDRGYETLGVDRSERTAVVRMKWDYSGGAVFKNFYMVRENGRWKIDRIGVK